MSSELAEAVEDGAGFLDEFGHRFGTFRPHLFEEQLPVP